METATETKRQIVTATVTQYPKTHAYDVAHPDEWKYVKSVCGRASVKAFWVKMNEVSPAAVNCSQCAKAVR